MIRSENETVFCTNAIQRGYESFEQVVEAIKKGEFPLDLLEKGTYCPGDMTNILEIACKGTSLEKEIQRMLEARKIELEIFDKLYGEHAEIGYPIEEQRRDRAKGMSQREIEEKRNRCRYIYECIKLRS